MILSDWHERQHLNRLRLAVVKKRRLEEKLDKRVDKEVALQEIAALDDQIKMLQELICEYRRVLLYEIDVPQCVTPEKIPVMLVQLRIASGLSQKELADALGLKRQQVSRWERTLLEQPASTAFLIFIAASAKFTAVALRSCRHRQESEYEPTPKMLCSGNQT
jgi:DNA-binding XRE family transcriptional regulator